MIRCLALFLFILCPVQTLRAAQFSIAPFTADVTVPIGHGMMGGLWQAKKVDPACRKKEKSVCPKALRVSGDPPHGYMEHLHARGLDHS